MNLHEDKIIEILQKQHEQLVILQAQVDILATMVKKLIKGSGVDEG